MGILDKVKSKIKEYEAGAPERRKKHIEKLKYDTQSAKLEAQKLQSQSKLRQLREARYSSVGSPIGSGVQIGGTIGNTSPKTLKPKKKKAKKKAKGKSITINF